jgi:hypothetical protein
MQKTTLAFFLSLFFLGCLRPVPVSGQTQPMPEKQPQGTSMEKPTGFYNVTSFTPVTTNGDFFNSVQTVCGYKLIPQLAIGAGIGYEHFRSIATYADFKADLSLLPVFIDIRYTVLKGKVSPVVTVEAGYKFLLNKPSTQTIYDTVYSSILTVAQRDDLMDYEVYSRGGAFITAGIGIKIRITGILSLYCAPEYSLWSISGNHYYSDHTYLEGQAGWAKVNSTEAVSKTLSYIHVFQVRLGIVF